MTRPSCNRLRGELHTDIAPREARNNYGLSVLVQRYDLSAEARAKGSFSPEVASVLSFSPYMCILMINCDQPPRNHLHIKRTVCSVHLT